MRLFWFVLLKINLNIKGAVGVKSLGTSAINQATLYFTKVISKIKNSGIKKNDEIANQRGRGGRETEKREKKP